MLQFIFFIFILASPGAQASMFECDEALMFQRDWITDLALNLVAEEDRQLRGLSDREKREWVDRQKRLTFLWEGTAQPEFSKMVEELGKMVEAGEAEALSLPANRTEERRREGEIKLALLIDVWTKLFAHTNRLTEGEAVQALLEPYLDYRRILLLNPSFLADLKEYLRWSRFLSAVRYEYSVALDAAVPLSQKITEASYGEAKIARRRANRALIRFFGFTREQFEFYLDAQEVRYLPTKARIKAFAALEKAEALIKKSDMPSALYEDLRINLEFVRFQEKRDARTYLAFFEYFTALQRIRQYF